MIEDVVMTEIKPEENAKETKDNSLYQEYRKALGNIEKAVPLKDTKTLSLYARLLNKFRRGFTDEDCQYICDNFLKSRFNFTTIPSMSNSVRVSTYIFIWWDL
jgi:hypothetical protein